MKTMKTKKLTMLLFVMVFTGMSISSFAQYGNMRGQNLQKGQRMNQQNEWMCPIPDLTEDQKDKIEVLRLKHQKKMIKKRNLVREHRAHLITLKFEDELNMKEINKEIDKIADIRAEMSKKRIANQQEVRKLLTDDQKLFFDNWKKRGNRGNCGYGFSQRRAGKFGKGFSGRKGKGRMSMRNGMYGQRMNW